MRLLKGIYCSGSLLVTLFHCLLVQATKNNNSGPSGRSTYMPLLQLGPTLDYSYSSNYSNWAGTIRLNDSFLVIYPRNGKQVVEIANWAHTHKRYLRVQGFRHSFSTLVLGPGDSASDTVILDMRRHMKALDMGSVTQKQTLGNRKDTMKTVVCQPGVSMDSFFNFTEANGVSVSNAPVLGDATIGGVLAIGGHGQAVRTLNSLKPGGLRAGLTFGTMSNTILGFKAVVWEEKTGKYRLKTFYRTDQDSGPFLMHIGRALITEFTLMVGEDYNMRVVSYTDIPRTELFSTQVSSSLRTFTSFMNSHGSVDALLYTFVDTPWLRVLSTEEEEESKPAGAREVTEPYPFSSFYGRPLTSPPTLGPQVYQAAVNGLRETKCGDVWGPSKNLLLNMNMPLNSGPVAYSGFVVVTSRLNVQRVGKELSDKFVELTEEYKAKGKVPIEVLMELRTNGLDDPRDVLLATAVAPPLSPLRPVKNRAEWDVGLWMNTFTSSGAEGSNEFMRRFEEWAYARWNGTGGDGLVRPEWAKRWGYSDEEGAQGNQKFLTETIPQVFGVEEWNRAVGVFDKYDPHKTFTNKFLRGLLVPYGKGGGGGGGVKKSKKAKKGSRREGGSSEN